MEEWGRDEVGERKEGRRGTVRRWRGGRVEREKRESNRRVVRDRGGGGTRNLLRIKAKKRAK